MYWSISEYLLVHGGVNIIFGNSSYRRPGFFNFYQSPGNFRPFVAQLINRGARRNGEERKPDLAYGAYSKRRQRGRS
jgi:hypothetical protein